MLSSFLALLIIFLLISVAFGGKSIIGKAFSSLSGGIVHLVVKLIQQIFVLAFYILKVLFQAFYSSASTILSDANNKTRLQQVISMVSALVCFLMIFLPWIYPLQVGIENLSVLAIILSIPTLTFIVALQTLGRTNFRTSSLYMAIFITVLTVISNVLYVWQYTYPSNLFYISLVFSVCYVIRVFWLIKSDNNQIHKKITHFSKEKSGNRKKSGADISVVDSRQKSFGISSPIVIPEISRYQHLHVIGPTGTGKSILATNLAVQDIMNEEVGVIVIEPMKGLVKSIRNFANNIGRKVHYFDPTDPRTVILNPLDGELNEIDKICEVNIDAFVGYLGSNAVEYFKNRQKNTLRMAIKVVKNVKGDHATYLDLLDLLRPDGNDTRQEYLRKLKDERLKRDLRAYQEEHKGNNRNDAMHNYAGLIDYLREITENYYIERSICKKSTVKMRDIFEKGEVLLVTTAKGSLSQSGDILGRLIITMLQAETFARTDKDEDADIKPIAVYIDEVQNYVSEKFAEIFEMARKAKLMMHIFHQNIAQLEMVSKRLSDSILSNARQKIIFGGGNPEDNKYFSELVGEEYTIETSVSSSVSDFFDRKTSKDVLKARMNPTEIRELPGYNTATGEPAHVLCIFNIYNKIKIDIGFIKPIDRELLKDKKGTYHTTTSTSGGSTESTDSETTTTEKKKKTRRGTRGKKKSKSSENSAS